MAKILATTYSLVDSSSLSSHTDPKLMKISQKTNEPKMKNSEPLSSEHGTPGRVRFLEPNSPNAMRSNPSRSPRRVPSFDNTEVPLEYMNDIHQDGPNSVSRGLQTDISSASVIDWVIAQKSSSTGDRYLKLKFISYFMDKYISVKCLLRILMRLYTRIRSE